MHYDGDKFLVHSADMTTGDCKETNGTNSCEGVYRGDIIKKDYMINGCVRDFLDNEPGAYNAYIKERDNLIKNI